MVSSIVGNYLIEKGLITKEQFRDLLNDQQKVRVKLGLIAVAEGLMTQEEADRVNQLQTVMDKRFGDIAVEKGYLTDGQVGSLLKKQGNAYLAFAQALENQQLMTVEQLEQYMLDYRFENNFTASDIEDIKSDDVDRILPLFLPVGSEKYMGAAGTAVRTLMRCVDTELYPGKAAVVSEIAADNAAVQKMEGTPNITCGMAGKGDDLLYTASKFGQEEFPEVNEDALDAIGELLNCINGLYASAVSKEGTFLELLPPEFKTGIEKAKSREMLALPVYINGRNVNFLIAIDDEIEIK
ncbi:MAG: chemotaxis protein CheX [Suilimivivens sp.]